MSDHRHLADHSHRGKRFEGDRGATLIEAAVVTPLFVLLIFAIFELGLAFRDQLTVQNGSQEGVRAASIKGNQPDADFAVLRAVEYGLDATGTDIVDYVVVFKADGPEGVLPPACRASSQAGLCNRYTSAHFRALLDNAAGNDTGNFRCGALDRAWCPTGREASLSAGPDYVGVHIEVTHKYLTGILGGSVGLGSTSILPIEPDSA